MLCRSLRNRLDYTIVYCCIGPLENYRELNQSCWEELCEIINIIWCFRCIAIQLNSNQCTIICIWCYIVQNFSKIVLTFFATFFLISLVLIFFCYKVSVWSHFTQKEKFFNRPTSRRNKKISSKHRWFLITLNAMKWPTLIALDSFWQFYGIEKCEQNDCCESGGNGFNCSGMI